MSDQNPYATPDASLATASSGTYNPSIFSFSGRIGRLRYLAYNTGVNMLFFAIMIPVLSATGFMTGMAGGDAAMSAMGGIVMILVYIATFVITVMFGKRRLNDLNRSGWFILLMIIPLINFVLIIYLIFFAGTDGNNDYGPEADANTIGVKILAFLFPALMLLGVGAAILIPGMQM